MDAYLLDWVNLLLRWTHIIVAIAWIGASFYFVFLDTNLVPPTDPNLKQKGVGGELWAVHGGGFYNPQKYPVSPKEIPDNLHWFYWEAYSTWLTGFALFTVMYLFNPGTFLVDKSVYDWPAGIAAIAAVVLLAAFWFAYDWICRLFGEKNRGDLIVGIGVIVFIVFASWLSCQLFSGRAAFLLVGAMIATAMSANVFFWIIPGQKTVIAQMKAGEPIDPVHGQRAKQRSVHNTYFTLPVILAMVSNHYGWLYEGKSNWLVLIALMLAGALIRHSFVARHQANVHGRRVPWEYAAVGVVIIGFTTFLLMPKSQQGGADKADAPVTFAQVQSVINQRCAVCHNEQVQQKNVALHAPDLIGKHAQKIYQQAVVLKLMPMANSTKMTAQERALVARWFEAGAPTQ